MSNSPKTRRSIQQIKHCVEEALAIVEHNENRDLASAVEDLEQALALLQTVLPILRTGAKMQGGLP